MAECLFCKIAKGEIKSAVVYDDPNVMAFLDIRPANPGHTLVITKGHFAVLPQLPEQLNSNLLQLVKLIAQAQVEILGAEGVNVLQNNGAVAGQAVPHIHFHVIPRYKGDKVMLNWDAQEMEEGQMEEIQKRLSQRAKEIASGVVEEKKTPAAKISEEPEEKPKKGKMHRVRSRNP